GITYATSGSSGSSASGNPKLVGRPFPSRRSQVSPRSSDRYTPQWFCCQSRSGRFGCTNSLCTHCPTSGYGSGMNSAATLLLIGVQLPPPSSLLNVPAAEIATYMIPSASWIECVHMPPAPAHWLRARKRALGVPMGSRTAIGKTLTSLAVGWDENRWWGMAGLKEQERWFLDRNVFVGTVTTRCPDGSPHSTIVWVDVE